MMARLNLTALITTILFVHTAVAAPFRPGGWFHHKYNDTDVAFPTGGFPTGVFPTGYPGPTGWSKAKRHRGSDDDDYSSEAPYPVPSGVFPTGVFPTGVFPTGVFPTGVYPTGVFPTGDYDKRGLRGEAAKRFGGALKDKRSGDDHYWGGFPTGYPSFPTGTGFVTGTGYGAPCATGT